MHPTPRWRSVVLEQIRVVGSSIRREALAVAVVLTVGTVMIGTDLAHGGPGLDGPEIFPTAAISFFFPFAVWRGEKRFAPSFLWTLPVDRRRLALARVLAGGVWLLAALACFVAWLLALGLIAGVSPGRFLPRIALIPTIATYLLGSAIVLGLRHPLRWVLGTAGVLFLLMVVGDDFGRTETGEWRIFVWSGVLRWLVYGPYGVRAMLDAMGVVPAAENAGAAWQTVPTFGRWAITTFLSIGAGLLALWAAASRHRETRRH
jgi:hypothetical protein